MSGRGNGSGSGEPLAPVPEDERLRRAKELGDEVTPETEETQEDPEERD